MFDLEADYKKVMEEIMEEVKHKQEWVVESQDSLTYVFQHQESQNQMKLTLEQQVSMNLMETNQRLVMVVKREIIDGYIDYLIKLKLDNGHPVTLTVCLKENGLLKTSITADFNGIIFSFSAYEAMEKVCQTFEQLIKQDPAYRLHFAVHDVPFELREC